ncbi:MAG TPA: thiamine phosphate synthase [Thiomicrorhabdus sp.]|nr:thiamine phosphate synthase [Thiomicrorhabdus sp.]
MTHKSPPPSSNNLSDFHSHLKANFKGLYVITDPTLCPTNTLIKQVTQALMGGAKIIQFRDKTSDFSTQLALSKQLKTLCEQHQAYFIVNDHIELAKQSGAHGLHIGKEDHDLHLARQQLGARCIIGVSCYNDLALATHMQTLGANYVAFGRFFPSNTKPNAPQAEIDTLIQAKKTLHIPVVAIGGITTHNAPQLIATGVDALAVIQGVFAQKDIQTAALNIHQQFTV